VFITIIIIKIKEENGKVGVVVGDGGGVRVHHQGGTTIPTSCALLLAIGSIDVMWNYCTNVAHPSAFSNAFDPRCLMK
jgi:hypothetical protein